MGDCGCDKAKAELEEYLHQELCSEDAADIRAHLDGCTDCAEEHTVGVQLTMALKQACSETAPEQLKDQVLARLRAVQATHS
jgi:anti-sigma factor (TIGR02949 family)